MLVHNTSIKVINQKIMKTKQLQTNDELLLQSLGDSLPTTAIHYLCVALHWNHMHMINRVHIVCQNKAKL